MSSCDAATYKAWEQAIISQFFSSKQISTHSMPTPGRPASMSKRKFILAAIADDSIPGRIAAAHPADTAPVKRRWYHIGDRKLSRVSDGMNDVASAYRYPCCDLGGLTNYTQKLGTQPKWASPSAEATLDGATDLHALARTLHARWCELTGKRLPPELMGEIQCWLVSVSADMGSATLRFHPPPPEHRVLLQAGDVKAALGAYYVRCFGDPERHAREASDAEVATLFCGVAESFVTPNLNDRNIMLEYAPYGSPVEGVGGGLLGLSPLVTWRFAVGVAVVAAASIVVLAKR